jgi:PAS domain S-box-containing protein
MTDIPADISLPPIKVRHRFTTICVPVLVALTMAIAAIAIWHLNQNDRLHRHSDQMRSDLAHYSARIEAHVETRLDIGEHLKRQWLDGNIRSYQDFLSQTRSVHDLFRDFQAINWIDPQGVIQWVSPLAGNENAQGLDVRSLPIPAVTLMKAEESLQTRITPPIMLAQGGTGFVAYIPLTNNDNIEGFLNIVFKVSPLIEAAVSQSLMPDYHLTVTDDGKSIYNTDNMTDDHIHEIQEKIAVGNRTWTISIMPTVSHMRAHASLTDVLVLGFGLMLSAAVGFLFWLAMVRQDTLSSSEKRFRSLFHQSPLGVSLEDYSAAERIIDRLSARGIVDFEAHFENNPDDLKEAILGIRLVEVNDAFLQIFGSASSEEYFDNELTGVNWSIPEWRQFYLEEILSLASGQTTIYHDVLDTHRDGSPIHIRCVSSVSAGHENDWAEIITTHEDFSERALREEELRNRDTMLQNAIQITGLGHWVWDQDSNTPLYISDEMEVIFDVQRDGYTYEIFLDRIHPDDRSVVDQMWMKEKDAYGTYNLEYRIIRTNGECRNIHEIAAYVPDANGKRGNYVGAVRDITEQKSAVDALQESEALLQESARLAQLGYMVWDATEDRCIFCSDIYADIHGATPVEFIDKASKMDGDFSFTHPEDREKVKHLIQATLDGETVEMEYRLLNADGHVRYVHSITRPITDDRGTVIELHEVLQDITRIARTEIRLQAALSDAEQANQAKSEFLATMSHEFRTPLNAILGFSEMIRQQYFGPLGSEIYEDYAKDIHNSGEHMLALTNDVLDIAAIEAGKLELDKKVLDVSDMLDGCFRNFEHQAREKDIELSLENSDDLPSIYADRRSILQIMQNLISNAIKFTGKAETIIVSALSLDGTMVIKVSDTGIGIPEEILPTITDPFTQSQADPHLAQSGSGLGLSIVKALVEEHDGELDIESVVNKGTTVTITFPAHRQVL